MQPKVGGAAGIEPATSRTRNENHTTRPRAQTVTILTLKCLYEWFRTHQFCQGAQRLSCTVKLSCASPDLIKQ